MNNARDVETASRFRQPASTCSTAGYVTTLDAAAGIIL
jgi:hypothetical protein